MSLLETLGQIKCPLLSLHSCLWLIVFNKPQLALKRNTFLSCSILWDFIGCRWESLISYELKPKRGFPHSSVGKESACSAGNLGSIPGLGRSSREGISYPLQYSWAFLLAGLVMGGSKEHAKRDMF